MEELEHKDFPIFCILINTCVLLSILLPLVCSVLWFLLSNWVAEILPSNCRSLCSIQNLVLLFHMADIQNCNNYKHVTSPSSNLKHLGKVWPWTYYITAFKMTPKSPQVSRIKIKIQIFPIIPNIWQVFISEYKWKKIGNVLTSLLKYKIQPRFWNNRVCNQTIHLIWKIMRNDVTIIGLN